jgi:hypothetical protein
MMEVQTMATFADDMQEFHEQLKKESIQRAYRGLMQFMLDLKTHLAKKYPDFSVPGGLYQGYMDMTYFSFTPAVLKEQQLKVAIVFVYEAFRFEVWLSAVNKQVQAKYWQVIKDSGWEQFQLVPTIEGQDAIIEHILVDNPDFRDPNALTKQIEEGTSKFIAAIETFLSSQRN